MQILEKPERNIVYYIMKKLAFLKVLLVTLTLFASAAAFAQPKAVEAKTIKEDQGPPPYESMKGVWDG